MDLIFTQLSSSLSTAQTIEQLVRPILDMLGSVTGMESTYLTSIDLDLQTQYVSFANNKDKLQIPEGLTVPWQDTLCCRALASGTLATDCVPALWGDSQAASELGIRSYVSAPIRSSSGDVLGTLCAASTGQHSVSAQVKALCQLFASIVSNFIEREILVEQLKVANEQLASYALTDLLTGLPNRRAMFDELEHLFAQGRRNHYTILVGVIDLDGFKLINDQFGHQGGDSFLQGMAQRLSNGLRAGDRVGRLGGDEFLFIGPGPARAYVSEGPAGAEQEDPTGVAQRMRQRLSDATTGCFCLAGQSVSYAGASVGVVAVAPDMLSIEEAISLADRQMYAVKNARKGVSLN
ncbi:GGDEF domain-containing protein [Aquitalea denitrificans]|uniref:GGDEF domain-containing protein n=1 Tax=Aquitalea denitrificans TaxID=519081 RepID=UPI00135B4450|nr:GGDEF domain-containing protein [Aquitalea denitrificans]